MSEPFIPQEWKDDGWYDFAVDLFEILEGHDSRDEDNEEL